MRNRRGNFDQEEWVQLHLGPGDEQPEIVHAHYVRHSFARHTHETYVIGLVEQGVQTFACGGQNLCTPAGHIFLINPGEAHTGESGTEAGYVYRTFYPSAAMLGRLSDEMSGRSSERMPNLTRLVVKDGELSRRLSAFHLAAAMHKPLLERETQMLSAMALLIRRYADANLPRRAATAAGLPVRRARDYLEAAYDHNITLTDLAGVAGVSRFHLARSFTAELGIPPHAYLESVRARHARALIAAGHPLADVALDVGYPDQSHLTRRFKRFVGMTPGQYAHDRKIAQDRRN